MSRIVVVSDFELVTFCCLLVPGMAQSFGAAHFFRDDPNALSMPPS